MGARVAVVWSQPGGPSAAVAIKLPPGGRAAVAHLLEEIRAGLRQLARDPGCHALTIVLHETGCDCDHEVPS